MQQIKTQELLSKDRPFRDLPQRLLNGEHFIVRHCLQELGLFDALVDASFKGITQQLGQARAEKIMALGLDKIHKEVTAAEIPDLTDAVYDAMEPKSYEILSKFVMEMVGHKGAFYFEQKPNVRFHIPQDMAAPYLKQFKEFAKRHGDGKITPHRAHRDSWVDCPSNLINVWVAVGEVKTGNGLTLYPESYDTDLANTGPYISADENPGKATTFDMAPGDVLLFHGDHVHGSEINVTDSTRHVISFRIVLEKPRYAHGHYHHYLYSPLASGPLAMFAGIPQNMAWSFVKDGFRRTGRKVLSLLGKNTGPSLASARASVLAHKSDHPTGPFPVSDLDDGMIHEYSDKICITKATDGSLVAFSRFCPHEGADLAKGVMQDGQVKCPWHNLSIDPQTGVSPCQTLKHLKTWPVEVRDGKVHVLESEPAAESA